MLLLSGKVLHCFCLPCGRKGGFGFHDWHTGSFVSRAGSGSAPCRAAHPEEAFVNSANSSSSGCFSSERKYRVSFSLGLEKQAGAEYFIDWAVSILSYVMVFLQVARKGLSYLITREYEDRGHVRVKVKCHILSHLIKQYLSRGYC